MNAPPIGPLQGKTWGTTRCVFSHDNTEIWEVHIDKGGFCSEHVHNTKWNRFVITKGRLKVTIFLEGQTSAEAETDAPTDCTILEAGDCTDVPPGKWHMFEALENVEGIEVYWTALDPSDITRRTQGGVRV